MSNLAEKRIIRLGKLAKAIGRHMDFHQIYEDNLKSEDPVDYKEPTEKQHQQNKKDLKFISQYSGLSRQELAGLQTMLSERSRYHGDKVYARYVELLWMSVSERTTAQELRKFYNKHFETEEFESYLDY